MVNLFIDRLKLQRLTIEEAEEIGEVIKAALVNQALPDRDSFMNKDNKLFKIFKLSENTELDSVNRKDVSKEENKMIELKIKPQLPKLLKDVTTNFMLL